jgi:hypothetical protein
VNLPAMALVLAMPSAELHVLALIDEAGAALPRMILAGLKRTNSQRSGAVR